VAHGERESEGWQIGSLGWTYVASPLNRDLVVNIIELARLWRVFHELWRFRAHHDRRPGQAAATPAHDATGPAFSRFCL
jgi:hypothetical protein